MRRIAPARRTRQACCRCKTSKHWVLRGVSFGWGGGEQLPLDLAHCLGIGLGGGASVCMHARRMKNLGAKFSPNSQLMLSQLRTAAGELAVRLSRTGTATGAAEKAGHFMARLGILGRSGLRPVRLAGLRVPIRRGRRVKGAARRVGKRSLLACEPQTRFVAVCYGGSLRCGVALRWRGPGGGACGRGCGWVAFRQHG
jgi:hypothetical protein